MVLAVWTARQWAEATDPDELRDRGQALEKVAITELNLVQDKLRDALREIEKQKSKVQKLNARLETLEKERNEEPHLRSLDRDDDRGERADAAPPAMTEAEIKKLQSELAQVEAAIETDEKALQEYDKDLTPQPQVSSSSAVWPQTCRRSALCSVFARAGGQDANARAVGCLQEGVGSYRGEVGARTLRQQRRSAQSEGHLQGRRNVQRNRVRLHPQSAPGERPE